MFYLILVAEKLEVFENLCKGSREPPKRFVAQKLPGKEIMLLFPGRVHIFLYAVSELLNQVKFVFERV